MEVFGVEVQIMEKIMELVGDNIEVEKLNVEQLKVMV